MSRESTLGRDAIRAQFHELAELLDGPTTVYLIGGGALTLLELKNATKDIDLIVESSEAADRLFRSLRSVGYQFPSDLGAEYEQLDAAFILEKGTRRFDVSTAKSPGCYS